jgi:hypothetical protein
MPILFPDYCEYTWYPCASHMFFDELCCFYAAAMLLVLLYVICMLYVSVTE